MVDDGEDIRLFETGHGLRRLVVVDEDDALAPRLDEMEPVSYTHLIIKSAYSTNIKERRDNTTAIMDPAGNVVVQVESSIPMLLAALLVAARGVVAEYKPEDIHPGDMFIVNDPYHGGGNHLPDITVVGPVFVGQKLIGWVGNTAHHSDIGGKVPGSTSGDADSLFQDCLLYTSPYHAGNQRRTIRQSAGSRLTAMSARDGAVGRGSAMKLGTLIVSTKMCIRDRLLPVPTVPL